MNFNKETVIISVIGIVFLAGFFGFIFLNGPQTAGVASAAAVNENLLVKENSHMTGALGAKVTVVEFGDYQCPACAVYNPIFKQVIDAYKSNPNFNFAYRNFPLPQHQNSWISAEAAEAASAQGKYWEMHNLLFDKQNDWAEIADPLPMFSAYAGQLGIDVNKFKTDVSDKKFADFIQSDLNDGNAVPIDHTPTVFINGVEQTDLSFEAMKAKIDSLLNN